MTTNIERRIQALEERRRERNPRIAVIHQRDDGSWPPDPPDAALVVAIRCLGIPYPADSPIEAL